MSFSRWLLNLSLLLCSATAAAGPEVTLFSPQGTVKAIRQVQVRFATPMVALGDPRLAAPFAIDCPSKGVGRWADPRNWIFDFEHDLPAGIRCRFELKNEVADSAGHRLGGPRHFEFDTGGPHVIQSEPWEGNTIDEEQIFMLGLDAPATPDSIEANVRCRAEGITETIGVRIVSAEERKTLLESNPYFMRRYASVLFKDRYGQWMVPASIKEEGTVRERFLQLMHEAESPLVLLQCKQRLPNGAKAWIDWGAGVTAATGVATTERQSLQFEVRDSFRATFRCERASKDAACIPALSMSLEFTSAIATADALRINLIGNDGRRYATTSSAGTDAATTWSVSFGGPFPERAKFTVSLPPDLKDDAGRALINAARFPLEVATDDDPPLAKFAADFGIIELGEHSALPVTVRNLEPNLVRKPAPPPAPAPSLTGFVQEALGQTDTHYLLENPVYPTVRGKILKFEADDPVAIGGWLTALRSAQRDDYQYDEKTERYIVTKRAGETALIRDHADATAIEIPRIAAAKTFEVIGIPLPDPGFYLVELASPRLGATLFGKPGTYYVQSLALVTNLGVHFKWGRESSLVWTTALDSGKPVPNAAVTIKDCQGKAHWQGKTDSHGIAAIDLELPRPPALPSCDWISMGLIATAQVGADIGIVASEWNEGIANWQFNLPSPDSRAPEIATTVFDRTLFRAGETVHMKHVVRHHTSRGFSPPQIDSLTLRARHTGSGEEYPLRATFDLKTSSGDSRWPIPNDAKQGSYAIEYQNENESDDSWIVIGEFRVESYRVPLLRAIVSTPSATAVATDTLPVDLQVNYLAGGPAGGMRVKLRGLVEPREVTFPDYEDFVFMNGNVQEGLVDQVEHAWSYRPYQSSVSRGQPLQVQSAILDNAGGARLNVSDLPLSEAAQTTTIELEYPDPNGETLTAATRVPLWPAEIILGLKPDSWAASQEKLKFQVLALGLDGKPAAGFAVTVDLLQRVTYSHRKRLIGGFYAYENKQEVKPIGGQCSGTSDAKGFVFCEIKSPVSGNVILRASARDSAGHISYANRDVWVAAGDEWWFPLSNEDRMDLLPERKHYEPGETARLQVRMPFRRATALVTVEREGIIDRFVTELSGKSPVVEIPIVGNHAPNMFVSVLVVRGRDAASKPTALVDLGRPAYKLGITELKVGWRAHELKVEVKPDRAVYKVRDKAQISIAVRRPDGSAVGANSEVILAAVDEGLLQLRANDSWKLLDAMMGRRGAEVRTATAQMQVIGKRHFGRKALAPGGGGGSSASGSRELFDTLLAWHGRVKLDAGGKATVEIPLNDSLTSFRIVAVATEGVDRFGTGETTIRATQDLMLFAGVPPLVRESDRYQASFTVRNASARPLSAMLEAEVERLAEDGSTAPLAAVLSAQTVTLSPGQAQELSWEITAPLDAAGLRWRVTANDTAEPDVRDVLSVEQKVLPAVAVRTFQATLTQLDGSLSLPVARPADAIPSRGDIRVKLQARLGDSLAGVREYMSFYDYSCLEQLISKAVVFQDEVRWEAAMERLPAFLDGNGFAKYFAVEGPGSDSLTAYILAIGHEAGWTIPEGPRTQLREALVAFIEGRATRESGWQTADLGVRKLAAIEALSRFPEGINTSWFDAIDIEPALWPTSAVIDWIDVLRRTESIPERDKKLEAALGILRARINFQGTTMTFSTERTDALWWLMISADVNANRALLSVLERADWAEDIPRLVTGSLGRHQEGHWSTTNANAWGVLAIKKFSARFEASAVAGVTDLALPAERHEFKWTERPEGGSEVLPWPPRTETLEITHRGAGKPWVTLQARAAIPLTAPLETGYKVRRTVSPVAQATPGQWQRGDVYRVRLDLEAQSDMTWVVVDDPIPGGASILGTGLGSDSVALTADEKREGWVWPAFEERRFDAFRAYYRFVPKGAWHVEYTVRLNNAGEFYLPQTRVEAMYAPEMFAEIPNAKLVVLP